MPSTKIKVKQLTGKVFSVDIDLDETVLELKKSIHTTLTSTPPESQRLILKGKFLKDTEKLKNYTIRPQDIIAVMVKRTQLESDGPTSKRTPTIEKRLREIADTTIDSKQNTLRRSKRIASISKNQDTKSNEKDESPLDDTKEDSKARKSDKNKTSDEDEDQTTDVDSSDPDTNTDDSNDDDEYEHYSSEEEDETDYFSENITKGDLLKGIFKAIGDTVVNSSAMDALTQKTQESESFKKEIEQEISNLYPDINAGERGLGNIMLEVFNSIRDNHVADEDSEMESDDDCDDGSVEDKLMDDEEEVMMDWEDATYLESKEVLLDEPLQEEEFMSENESEEEDAGDKQETTNEENDEQTNTTTIGSRVIEDSLTVLNQSDLEAISRLVEQGFTEEQASEVYISCEKDEIASLALLKLMKDK